MIEIIIELQVNINTKKINSDQARSDKTVVILLLEL